MSTPGGYHNHAIIAGSHNHTFSCGAAMGHAMSVELEDMNPDIEVDVVDGYYFAYKQEDGYKRRVLLPMLDHHGHGNLELWAMRLKVEQLVAAMKIFYDRWTFVSGNDRDLQIFKACETELENRRAASPFLHSHQLPAHTHQISCTANNYPHSHWHPNDPYAPGNPPVVYWDVSAE